MPDIIQFTAGHKNMYTYDASGRKLEAVTYTVMDLVNVPIGTISSLPDPSRYTKLTTDYVGNMIYENGALKEILLPEGYYQGGVYYYYLKDHLGDNRVVINSSGTIMEKSHYYPSGMRFYPESTSNSAALPYRYNGKELEAMNGLNEYDYGARRRGAGLPVWTAVDPLAEKRPWESPYSYCGNNPINRTDPTGMIWDDQKAADALKSKADDKIKHLNEVSSGIQEQLKNDKLTDDEKKDLNSKISDLSDRVSSLAQSKSDIDQLGNDKDHTYVLNDKGGGNMGDVSMNADGKISINAPTDGLAFHEIKHGIQSLDAKSFTFLGGKLQNAGTTNKERGENEVKAYQAQFSYTGFFSTAAPIYGPKAITPALVGNMKDPQTGKLLYPFMNQSK